MKLEVGKYYVCRNTPHILKIRVDTIREELMSEYPCSVVIGTVFHTDGKYSSKDWYLDGRYSKPEPHPWDLMAEYQEPELTLGPKDVGKRVKLRDGTITLIIEHKEGDTNNIRTVRGHTQSNGYYSASKEESNNDIVEVLD